MDEQITAKTTALQSAIAAWRADVPVAVTYPELPAAAGVEDSATAGVLAAMAHWPGEHATMAAHREAAAEEFHKAANAAAGIFTARDDEGAARITASQEPRK